MESNNASTGIIIGYLLGILVSLFCVKYLGFSKAVGFSFTLPAIIFAIYIIILPLIERNKK